LYWMYLINMFPIFLFDKAARIKAGAGGKPPGPCRCQRI
jgi:hypothetical protein